MKKLFFTLLLAAAVLPGWAEDVSISDAAGLKAYADGINDGTESRNAKLTANIDLSSYNPWTPIGTNSNKFKGTFDGQGYRITNMTINGSVKEQGLFGVVSGGATIKNLIVDSSCTITGTDGHCLAAFVGCCNNDGFLTFENCGNEANVTGGSEKPNNAGFLGCNYGTTKILFKNCYNKGNISGGKENGIFCGWTGKWAFFNNCYNIGSVENGEWARGSKTQTNCYDLGSSDGTITSGELCFKLNGEQTDIKWYQNLTGTTDAFPVPFSTGHSRVYAVSSNCNGSSASGYSNNSTDMPAHNLSNGFCTVCNSLDVHHLTPDGEGYFSIGSANDLHWFADYVKKISVIANAKLTANIDYTAYKQGFIGTSQAAAFFGTFDGQGHTIQIDIVNNGTTGRTGLFAYINAATIKNLIVEGNATSANSNCVGGLGGRSDSDGTLIENVVVKTAVSFTGTNSDNDATCGGFFANMEAKATLRNCAFLGSITTPTGYQGNGGLVGWAGSEADNKYENCLVAPVSYTQTGNSADFARHNPSTTNCFKVNANDSKLSSGELCYNLNGNQSGGSNWFQTLGTDATPLPFSTSQRVFYGSTHDPNYYNYNLVNDIVQIKNINELQAFSELVRDGATTVNAELTADITQPDGFGYLPIGTEDHPYIGTFDGHNHSVTLCINNYDDYSYQGLFGVVTDGVFIKNVIVKGFVKGVDYVGGIVGGTKGGSGNTKMTNIWNCGNEANISAKGTNGAGIIGVNMSGSASIILLNCYNTGEVNSNKDGGAMSGWLGGGWSNVRNCYNSGTIKNNGNTSTAFGRNNGCYFTNCYYTASSGTCNDGSSNENTSNGRPSEIADDAVASGQLCWNLGSDNFTQDLSAENHPTFGSKEVHAGKWFNDADWDTFYNEVGTSRTSYVLNLDETKTSFNLDPNFTLTAKNVNVARNIPAGEWIGLCLPFDYDIPSGWEVRELDHVNGTGESASMVFTQVTTTIEAGKPYIVKPSSAVTDPITATNKTIVTAASTVAEGGVNMIGNFAKTSIPVGSFYINTSSQLKKLTGSAVDMKGFRAYFTVGSGSGVKALSFDFDDDATGIENLNVNDNLNEGAIYNLAGQRLNKAQKGINIINGKKILK